MIPVYSTVSIPSLSMPSLNIRVVITALELDIAVRILRACSSRAASPLNSARCSRSEAYIVSVLFAGLSGLHIALVSSTKCGSLI